MKKTILAVTMIIALASCQSGKNEESKKTEEVTAAQVATTEGEFFAVNGKIVTPESYPTDETSRQLLKSQDLVGVNNFNHKRQLTPTDMQPVVRMNRDTYYSMAVIDVSKGASITMPEIPEGKYMSIQPVTLDHRIQAMKYGAGTFELSTHTSTHLYVVIRLDATFTEAEAKEIQDKMSISSNSENSLTAMPVNEESFTAVEDALKSKMQSVLKRDGVDALKGMFTDPKDPSNEIFTQEKYELGAALGWGGAQMIDNIYELSPNYSTDNCYQLTFEDPENLAFWSITVYDKKGFMFNDLANFSSNTAKANADGTYTISFGCGADAPNNMEIANPSEVFNIAVRHYQPSKRVFEDDYRLAPLMKEVPIEE
jgi:hypothetical protein